METPSLKFGTLDFNRMTPRTREVLLARLNKSFVTEPRFFTRGEFERLRDLAEFTLPQKDDAVRVDLAGVIDSRFADHAPGKGWRFDELPPAPEAYREVLQALEKSSIETLLESKTPSWIALFWEDFLADITETYYSHPMIQASIGAFGMMDERA